jgi:hypothetical protein
MPRTCQTQRKDDSSVRSSTEYDDQRRKYRAARESFHKGMATNSQRSQTSAKRGTEKAGNKYDEFDLYESRDLEGFTSSDLNTLIAPNPLQAEKQFSSLANSNMLMIPSELNTHPRLSHDMSAPTQKKAPASAVVAAPSLALATAIPANKSRSGHSGNSSNVSTPFAHLPKFKANSSDDEGSDSEYSGEIKYYDLNRVVISSMSTRYYVRT